MIPFILIGLVVFLMLIVVIMVFARKKKLPPTDYYAFFVMGLALTLFGVVQELFFKEKR